MLRMQERSEKRVADNEPSANEHVQNAGKKTVMPTDVFQALEDTEFGFLREPLEAEFASAYPLSQSLLSSHHQPTYLPTYSRAASIPKTSDPPTFRSAPAVKRKAPIPYTPPRANQYRIQSNPIRQALHLSPKSRSSKALSRHTPRSRHLRPDGRHTLEEAARGGR